VSEGAIKSFTTASYPAPPTLVSPPLLPQQTVPPAAPKVKVLAPKKKAPTKAQKLAKALKTCAKKPKSKRAACQKQARKKY
jgi:hypothetical protein